jgi:hypothetical protein
MALYVCEASSPIEVHTVLFLIIKLAVFQLYSQWKQVFFLQTINQIKKHNNRIIHKSICSYSREFQILNCLIFQGVLCRTLQGHGHWVNILALSTDYVMRTGAFDPASATVVHAEV